MSRRNKGYFANFPQIEYQGKIARSLMARPKIVESLLSNPNSFYEYEIKNDLRPDMHFICSGGSSTRRRLNATAGINTCDLADTTNCCDYTTCHPDADRKVWVRFIKQNSDGVTLQDWCTDQEQT